MTIDSVIRKHHEDREREFHAALVRAGVRPEGSRAEDYRPKHEQPSEQVKAVGLPSEAGE